MASKDQSQDTGEAVKTGKISVSNVLAHQHIDDQAAGGLPNSWREATQNGIDSPESSLVRLQYSPFVSIIDDDGEGLNLLDEEDEDVLTKLGLSTKSRDDNSTYGQFGVGWGQVISKGLVIVQTQNSMVVFDYHDAYTSEEIKEILPTDPFPGLNEFENGEHPLDTVHGLNYAIGETSGYTDGMTVIIHHYENSVPDSDSVEWQEYEEEYRDLFRYVPDVAGVEITVNGDSIEPDDPLSEEGLRSETRTVETENAYIAVCNSVVDDITVYSQGLKVCDIDGKGMKGRIITKENLDVNIARNDIKHSDNEWQEIKETVEELRIDILDDTSDNRLYSNGRQAMLDRMVNNEELREKWDDREIIPMTNDKMVSLKQVQNRDEIGIAQQDDGDADKLIEAGEYVIDGSTTEVQTICEADIDLPNSFNIEERVEEYGLDDDYEILDEDELNMYQIRKLLFARAFADELRYEVRGFNRQIVWGRHDGANAWTDGDSYIALTDTVTTSNRKEVWMSEIMRTVCHEVAHNKDSQGTGHPPSFSEQFRKIIEHPTVEETFSDLAEDIVKYGMESTLKDRGYYLQHYK